MKVPWVLKLLVVVAVHLASAALLVRGITHAPLWQILPAMIAGHLVLDTIILLAHWCLDNYFSPKTPVIGDVVFYFREHHHAPMAMFSRGYVDNNFENALMGGLFQLPTLLWSPSPFLDILIGTGSFGSAYITLIHKWAHLDDPGPIARALQRLRLVVGRRHHDAHHRGEGRSYGLAAGWVDPLFDDLGVLAGLERLLFRLTGITPVHARGLAAGRFAPPAENLRDARDETAR